MGFILSHWHCILPIIGIAAAVFFIRDNKGGQKRDNASHKTTTALHSDKD